MFVLGVFSFNVILLYQSNIGVFNAPFYHDQFNERMISTLKKLLILMNLQRTVYREKRY